MQQPAIEALKEIVGMFDEGPLRSRRVGPLPRATANRLMREIEGIARAAINEIEGT